MLDTSLCMNQMISASAGAIKRGGGCRLIPFVGWRAALGRISTAHLRAAAVSCRICCGPSADPANVKPLLGNNHEMHQKSHHHLRLTGSP